MSSIDRTPWPWVVLLSSAICVVPGHARGDPRSEPAASSEPEPSTRVQVNLVGDLGADQSFAALLREWLDSSEIVHSIESQPSLALADLKTSQLTGPPVRIWLVLKNSETLRLYLTEPREQRYLVRDIPLSSGLDELGRERAAQVVLTSALAFLERRASTPWPEVEQAFKEPSAAPALAQADTTPRASRPRGPSERRGGPVWELGLGAGYAAVASDGLVHGPGAVFDFGVPTRSARFALVARGLYRFWPDASSPRVRIAARGPALGFGGAAELVLESAFRPYLEAGAGVDFVLLTPQEVPESDVEVRASRSDLRAFAALSAGLKWRASNVWASVGARAELAFADTHYDVATEQGNERELALPRFRPGGFLDVGWLIGIGE